LAAILEAQGLTKRYGEAVAVDRIDLMVEEGEIFGLLGPNGAGKTTTISMLTGVLEPTAGDARIGGRDIRDDARAVKQMCGLVPQDLALYPTLSARANLQFFGRIYGLRGRELDERIDDVLEVVALSDRADDAIESFSGGMKRRINIAAGLVHRPRLLFLDEPTVGVDPQSRNHIFESVQQLNRDRGMSIIYTSHYMEEVELLCDRVAIVDQGKVIADDTIKDLVATLGGGVIELGLESLDEGMLADIRGLPAVAEVSLIQPSTPSLLSGDADETAAEAAGSAAGPTLKIQCVRSQEALVQVFGYLNERDLSFTSLRILEPNLESVFLHLTGKRLRD
jgi:ABC-2 type transport system ATP-binding protein